METEISKLQAAIHAQEDLVDDLQMIYVRSDKAGDEKTYLDARHDLKIMLLRLEEAIEYVSTTGDTE